MIRITMQWVMVMLRYGLALLLLLRIPATGSPGQPMPFSTDSLAGMALSRPGGPAGDIAFAHQGDIYTVTLDGKHFRRLTNDGRNAFPMWSRDGKGIAFTKGTIRDNDWVSGELWVMTSDGKFRHSLTSPESLIAVYPVAWLPDDSGLLTMRMYLESDVTPGLDVVALDGKPHPLMRKWMEAGRKAGFIRQFVEGPEEFTPGKAGDFSPDGKRMIFTAAEKWSVDAPDLEAYWMDIDGSNLKRLDTMLGRVVNCLRWNNSGSRLLSMESCWDCDPVAFGMILRDNAGRRLKKLAVLKSRAYNNMDWSPDDKQIVYGAADETYMQIEYPVTFSEMSDRCSLWIMNADGSGKHKLADHACTPSWR